MDKFLDVCVGLIYYMSYLDASRNSKNDAQANSGIDAEN